MMDILSWDKILIDKLNRRNKTVFELLFHNLYSQLCYFASKIVRDDEAVKDIVQEVFIKFWESETQFENASLLKSYLYTCVQSKSINYIEKETNRKRIREDIIEKNRVESDFLSLKIESEVINEIYKTIDELPSECRKVFVLSYVELKNIKEISSLLNIAETTVKTQRRRAKAYLQERLKYLYIFLIYFFY